MSFGVEFPSQIRWSGYQNLVPSDILNTFRYIFNKFKKGIFIQIKDNAISVFLPFSKNNFTNEWHNLLKADPTKFNSLMEVVRKSCDMGGYKFDLKHIQQDSSKWYGNDGLIRYEYPIGENDSGVSVIYHMLTELCKNRKVPDMEFFVNRRDFPILRTDGTEPYQNFFGQNTKLKSHSYDRYCPIMSMCSSSQYADIPIPTWEDWSRTMENEGVYFANIPYHEMDNNPIDIPWDSRVKTAVFRGSSSGLGVNRETNPRLNVSLMSKKGEVDSGDGVPYLDAGITKWNTRPRKDLNSNYIDVIDRYDLKLVNSLSFYQQSQYRYIIHIDGHSSAYRLSRELSYGSVILIVRPKYQLWFSHWLQPYTHYVPVQADCSDLIKQVQWCKSHDDECRQIAINARKLWEDSLCKNGILDFLQSTLVRIKKRTGTFRYKIPTLMAIQKSDEEKWIERYKKTSLQFLSDLPLSDKVPNISCPRCVEKFQAIQWISFKYPEIFENLQVKDLSSNINSVLKIARFDWNQGLLVKTGKNLVHEAFVGMSCVNKLLGFMPNFSYTINLIKGSLYSEYFKNSITFLEYLQSPERFKFNTYLGLLMHISLILHESQIRCGFIHWDLNPWNILLDQSDNTIGMDYLHTNTQYVRIETRLNPIIIDYEKSHCIVGGVHHGIINPFKMDYVHDILTILLSSISVILKYQSISKKELGQLFTLTNFFSGTKYTGGQIFKNVHDLKLFLDKSKKYAELISTPKYELSSKTCFDFCYFLQANFGVELNMSSTQSTIMHWGSPTRILSDNTLFEKMLMECPITDMNTFQCLCMYNRLIVLRESGISEHLINEKLDGLIEIIKEMEDIEEPQFGNVPEFDENSFENGIILDKSELTTTATNYNDLKMEVIQFISNSENSRFYIRKWKNLIQLDSMKYLRDYANVNTLLLRLD
jgi:hypothetical protein